MPSNEAAWEILDETVCHREHRPSLAMAGKDRETRENQQKKTSRVVKMYHGMIYFIS